MRVSWFNHNKNINLSFCRDVLHARLQGFLGFWPTCASHSLIITKHFMNLSFCRDVLYARLLVLNKFQKSIRLIIFQTLILRCRDDLHARLLVLIVVRYYLWFLVETTYTGVSWFNHNKTFYEFIFL